MGFEGRFCKDALMKVPFGSARGRSSGRSTGQRAQEKSRMVALAASMGGETVPPLDVMPGESPNLQYACGTTL